MASVTPLKIGFVGCGLIGRYHAKNLLAVEGVRVGAVHDTDPDRADRFARDFAGDPSVAVASADDVIAASDAVYVCTWTSEHRWLVDAIAAAGKPVFCEKPLATDLAGAEAMTAAVTKAGVINQVGLVLRSSPAFRWLHHQVSAEPAGRGSSGTGSAGAGPGPVMNIVFRDDQYLPTQGMYHSTWRADRELAGAGTLLEHSIHDLDLLRWLMGPIRSVSARLGWLHGLDGIDDQASVLLVAESGAQAVLVSVWHDVLSRGSQRRVEVLCQRAVFTLDGDWHGPVSAELANDGGHVTTLEGRRLIRAAEAADGRRADADRAFIEALRAERPARPDFTVALEAHRLADAAYRSASDGGRPVELDGHTAPGV